MSAKADHKRPFCNLFMSFVVACQCLKLLQKQRSNILEYLFKFSNNINHLNDS